MNTHNNLIKVSVDSKTKTFPWFGFEQKMIILNTSKNHTVSYQYDLQSNFYFYANKSIPYLQ